MLDNLINLIRENAGDGILDNNAIPKEKNEQAVQTAGNSIISTLQNALAGGKLSDILGYFKSGGSGSHGVVQEATDNYAQDLQKNVGLNEADAQYTLSISPPA